VCGWLQVHELGSFVAACIDMELTGQRLLEAARGKNARVVLVGCAAGLIEDPPLMRDG
jgi:hypothetical protein